MAYPPPPTLLSFLLSSHPICICFWFLFSLYAELGPTKTAEGFDSMEKLLSTFQVQTRQFSFSLLFVSSGSHPPSCIIQASIPVFLIRTWIQYVLSTGRRINLLETFQKLPMHIILLSTPRAIGIYTNIWQIPFMFFMQVHH